MKALSTALTTGSLFLMTALPAMAQSWSWWQPSPPRGNGSTPASVPEIDASTALLACAAIVAALAFAWERKRRSA